MKKRIFNLTILLIFLLVGLTSCGNLFSSRRAVPAEQAKVSITGKLALNGAISKDVLNSTGAANRSAYPVIDLPSLTFSVIAEKANGVEITGSVSADKTSFTVPDLDLQENYTIIIRASRDGITVLEGSTSVLLTRDNYDTLIITMGAPIESLDGIVALPVFFDDVDVTKIVYRLDTNAPVSIPVTSSTATISIPHVSSGNHILDLSFYNEVTDGLRSAEVLTFHCKEVISVLPGLTTDTWIRSNAASDGGHLTDYYLYPKGMTLDQIQQWTSGPADFVISGLLAELFANTQFYVDSSYTGSEVTGSVFKPFKTLEDAITYVSSLPREGSLTGYYTILLEKDDNLTIMNDITITNSTIYIDVFDAYSMDIEETAFATINPNEHNIRISGDSEVSFAKIKFFEQHNSNGISTEQFMTIDSNAKAIFKACTLALLEDRKIENYGTIKTEQFINHNDTIYNCVFNNTEIVMKDASFFDLHDIHDGPDTLITLNIKDHSAEVPEIMDAGNEENFNFIFGEYQMGVIEGSIVFVPSNAYYVDPSSTTSSGTFRHPFSDLWDAIFYVMTDQVLSEKTIYIKGGTTDISFTGDNDFSTDKKITILAYDENPLNAATDGGVAEIRLSSDDTTLFDDASSGCLIFKGLMFSGSNICFTVGNGGDSQSSFTNCSFIPSSNPDRPIFDIQGSVTFDNCNFNAFSGDTSGNSVRIEPTGVLTLSGSTSFGANDAILIEGNSNGNGRIHIETALTPPTGANIGWKLNFSGMDEGDIIIEGPGAAPVIGNFDINGSWHIDDGGCIRPGKYIYVNPSTNGSDSYLGTQNFPYYTLSKAITEAPSGATIFIKTNSNLQSTDGIEISKSLSIKTYGNSSSNPVLLSNTRLNIINTGSSPMNVSISDINFQRSSTITAQGGCINITGNCVVDINHCEFYRAGSISTKGKGGFINIGQGAEVTCTNTYFIGGSSSMPQDGNGGYGGAICSQAESLTLDGCTFTNNTASSRGGAIISMSGVLTIKDCSFSGNTVTDEHIPESIEFGGFLHLQGTNTFTDLERILLREMSVVCISEGATFEDNVKLPLYWNIPDVDYMNETPFDEGYSQTHAADMFTIDERCGSGYMINGNGKIIQSGISGSVYSSPLYDKVTVSSTFCGGRQYKIDITDSEYGNIDISDVSDFTIEIWQHEDTIPEQNNWQFDIDRINFYNSLASGTYTVYVSFTYNSRSYSASIYITL